MKYLAPTHNRIFFLIILLLAILISSTSGSALSLLNAALFGGE